MDVKLVGENGRKFIDHLYNKINENKGSWLKLQKFL